MANAIINFIDFPDKVFFEPFRSNFEIIPGQTYLKLTYGSDSSNNILYDVIFPLLSFFSFQATDSLTLEDITSDVEVVGTVDIKKPGIYSLVFSVKDSLGEIYSIIKNVEVIATERVYYKNLDYVQDVTEDRNFPPIAHQINQKKSFLSELDLSNYKKVISKYFFCFDSLGNLIPTELRFTCLNMSNLSILDGYNDYWFFDIYVRLGVNEKHIKLNYSIYETIIDTNIPPVEIPVTYYNKIEVDNKLKLITDNSYTKSEIDIKNQAIIDRIELLETSVNTSTVNNNTKIDETQFTELKALLKSLSLAMLGGK